MAMLDKILNDLIAFSKANDVYYETTIGRIDYDVEGFSVDNDEVSIILIRRGTTGTMSFPISEMGAWSILQEMSRYCLRKNLEDNVYLQL